MLFQQGIIAFGCLRHDRQRLGAADPPQLVHQELDVLLRSSPQVAGQFGRRGVAVRHAVAGGVQRVASCLAQLVGPVAEQLTEHIEIVQRNRFAQRGHDVHLVGSPHQARQLGDARGDAAAADHLDGDPLTSAVVQQPQDGLVNVIAGQRCQGFQRLLRHLLRVIQGGVHQQRRVLRPAQRGQRLQGGDSHAGVGGRGRRSYHRNSGGIGQVAQ